VEDGKGKARRPRIDVHNDAILIFDDGSEVAVTVSDLSEGGFRLRSEEVLEVGETVWLRDRNGDMRAQIRWVTGFEAGASFLGPMPKLN
jgi:hypothetical protein